MDGAAQSGFEAANPRDVGSVLKPSTGGLSKAVPKERTRASFTEQLFVVCVLVLSTSAFVNLFPGELGIEHVREGEVFAQILWSVLYILLLYFVRKRLKELIHLAWQDKLYILLLGWAFFSLIWSVDRHVTTRHLLALVATSLFGIYLAVRYDLREQLKLVSTSLGIVIAASVGACLLFPNYGIQEGNLFDEPAWQGVFTHKNTLGRLAVLTALILTLYLLKRRRRLIILGGIVLLFVLIVLTKAKTALVYFVVGTIAFFFVRAFQRNPASRTRIILLAFLVFGGLATWTYYNWEDFTYSLGKDPGLTGRVALWGLSMTPIGQRPLLGYGYDAFWSDFYGPAAEFRVASGWLGAPHAHNGFINLWLDLGLVGVLLFVLGLAVTYRKALVLARGTKTGEYFWPVSFLTFLLAYSIPEVSFMSRNELLWILYVSVAFGLRINFAQRAQLRSGR